MPQERIDWLDHPEDVERPFDIAEATLTIRNAASSLEPQPQFIQTRVKVNRQQIEELLTGGQFLTVEVHQASTVLIELEEVE